jgi:hypothetical protein
VIVYHEVPAPEVSVSYRLNYMTVLLYVGSGFCFPVEGFGTLIIKSAFLFHSLACLQVLCFMLSVLYLGSGNLYPVVKQTPWPLVRKRTIPTERLLLVGEI